MKAFISGCEGASLTADEHSFFADETPWGLILFARNCVDRDQIKALVEGFRSCVGRDDAPVFIDQEGGRVQRLKPPHWRKYPAGAPFAALETEDEEKAHRALWLSTRLIAEDLNELNITVDCLPVLDVPIPSVHDVIGDRAYGLDQEQVSRLATTAANGLMAGGILPVIKHIPGHGRTLVDSHHELPRVTASLDELERVDFEPFRKHAHLPMAMTAHIIFDAVDANNPCTTSSKVIDEVIRSYIGFDGLLMSDDVSMNALHGDIATRTKACFAAGSDFVLHCNGSFEEMRAVAAYAPEVTGDTARRMNDCHSLLAKLQKERQAIDAEASYEELCELLSRHWTP